VGERSGPAPGDLLLRDFRPRQRLRVPATPIARPSMPAIDAHNHLGSTPFSGRWATGTAAELGEVPDKWLPRFWERVGVPAAPPEETL